MVPLVLVKNPIKITSFAAKYVQNHHETCHISSAKPDPFGIRPPGAQLPHGNRSPGEAFGKTMEDLGLSGVS